jgi:hypothetical protein
MALGDGFLQQLDARHRAGHVLEAAELHCLGLLLVARALGADGIDTHPLRLFAVRLVAPDIEDPRDDPDLGDPL